MKPAIQRGIMPRLFAHIGHYQSATQTNDKFCKKGRFLVLFLFLLSRELVGLINHQSIYIC